MWQAWAQNFELIDPKESYQANVGQLVKVLLKIRNNTDRPQFYVIQKVRGELGEYQKGYFCLENNCLEPAIIEFSKRVEPGEVINLSYTIETGNQQTQNTLKFQIFPKGNVGEAIDHTVTVSVEEKMPRSVFQSREITINDVYPNHIQDEAVIDYKISHDLVRAKIVMYNILGKSVGDFELPVSDTEVRVQTSELPSGIYFYTLYVNNSGVLTRKLVVRR